MVVVSTFCEDQQEASAELIVTMELLGGRGPISLSQQPRRSGMFWSGQRLWLCDEHTSPQPRAYTELDNQSAKLRKNHSILGWKRRQKHHSSLQNGNLVLSC